LGRLLTVVKELIERHFEGARQLFERFNGGNSVTIFDARNVATKKTSTLLDVTLGEFFVFAQCTKAITDNHAQIIHLDKKGIK